MKLALLAHALRVGGGISVGKNLITTLGKLAPDEHYLVSIPGGIGYETICRNLPHREVITLPHPHTRTQRWRFERRRLPEFMERFRPDVVVGLGSFGYQGKSHFPQAILFHNPYLIYSWNSYGRTHAWREWFEDTYRQWVFSRDLDRTGLLFTPTLLSADRIRRRYDYRGRFVTLPNAFSEFTQSGESEKNPPEELQPFSNCFKLFCLTKYYTHKNIEILVDMFDRFREELKGTVLFITVAEDHHPAVRRLLASIQRKQLEGMIVNIGSRWLQPELANYYSHMDALIMPSLMEIFSGSYLEAMHFGVPILTSDLDFAREVCGEAAFYFDPWNVASIKEAVVRLRKDHRLADSLIAAGRERIEEHFIGWNEVAGKFYEALRELAGGAGKDK